MHRAFRRATVARPRSRQLGSTEWKWDERRALVAAQKHVFGTVSNVPSGSRFRLCTAPFAWNISFRVTLRIGPECRMTIVRRFWSAGARGC